MKTVAELSYAARMAETALSCAGTATKNDALSRIADALIENEAEILAQNAKDLANAEVAGISKSMLDRLALSPARIAQIADGVKKLIALPDPVGRILGGGVRPNGLKITKRSVPLGVIGIIFEARPNVTVDAAALCLKSGNAVVLRGGKEAISSNRTLATIMRNAIVEAGLPADCICLVEDIDRSSAVEMMNMTGVIDVLIPRGGAGLIRSVVQNAHIPVIQTGVGNCHTYVESTADFGMALDIIENAKCSRPSVCNAMETLLVDETIADDFLPKVAERLNKRGVELRGCEKTAKIIACTLAEKSDWETEYNDLILAVKVVAGIDEAMAHIARYGTGHSEAIITNRYNLAEKFLNGIDAAAVYVNASTRFTDGYEFGLGAEIGISTQKLHARGPMGLEELTTVKFTVEGSGQIR